MSQLFTDLSAQEQEVVAGGVDFSNTLTNFSAKNAGVTSNSFSGPAGSYATSTGFDNRSFNAGNTLTAFVAPAIVLPAIPTVTFQ